MARRVIIDGKDTPTRIREYWQKCLQDDLHPTPTEFARAVGIAVDTLNHRYKEWADKIRERRDRKRGKRNYSPVARPKPKQLEDALREVDRLQVALRDANRRLKESENERDKLRERVMDTDTLLAENRHLRGAVTELFRRLTAKGATPEELAKLRRQVERGLVALPPNGRHAGEM